MTDPTPTPPPARPAARTLTIHTSTLVWGVVALATLVAGAVALAFAGWDPGAIIGLMTSLGGVSAVLLVQLDQATRTRTEQQRQGEQLATVERRTNGELSGTIRTAVHQALDERVQGGTLVALPPPRSTPDGQGEAPETLAA